jgi:hypothetical protein
MSQIDARVSGRCNRLSLTVLGSRQGSEHAIDLVDQVALCRSEAAFTVEYAQDRLSTLEKRARRTTGVACRSHQADHKVDLEIRAPRLVGGELISDRQVAREPGLSFL